MEAFLRDKAIIACYANASSLIGSGHVMRLIALAQEAQQQYEIIFCFHTCPDPLLNKIKQLGFTALRIEQKSGFSSLEKLKPVAIIIDDYQLSPLQHRQLAALDCYIVMLDDDMGHDIQYADLVINPSPNAQQAQYQKRAPEAIFCLGPKYTLLRAEFSQINPIALSQRNNVLVVLGGSDIKQLALPLCRLLLDNLPSVNISLLLGNDQHPKMEMLNQLAEENDSLNILINPPNVASVMACSSLALSGAGGTLGELASLGVPTLALVMADNQILALTSPLHNTWYQAIDLRRYQPHHNDSTNQSLLTEIKLTCKTLWYDKCRREQMSKYASQLIDTNGCQRIINRLPLDLQKMDTK